MTAEEQARKDAQDAVKKLMIDQPGISEVVGREETYSSRYHRELQMLLGDMHLGALQRAPKLKDAS